MTTRGILSYVHSSHSHNIGLYDVCNKWISFTHKKYTACCVNMIDQLKVAKFCVTSVTSDKISYLTMTFKSNNFFSIKQYQMPLDMLSFTSMATR